MAGFDSAPSRDKKLFEEIYTEFGNRVEKMVDSRFQSSLYLLWGSSASTLGLELIQRLQPLKHAWGKGDKDKARSVTEVCLYPLVSAWYSLSGKVGSKDRLRAAKTRDITGLLDIMGDFSQQKVKEFLDLDTQWVYEYDAIGEKSESSNFAYGIIFMSRFSRTVGMSEYIDWSRQTLPVQNLKDFAFVDKDRPCGELKMYDVAAATLETVYKLGKSPVKDRPLTPEVPAKSK